MVHAVQPPQQRHGMEHPVLDVDDEIEGQKRHDDRNPIRHVDLIEHTPAHRPRHARERNRQHRKTEAQHGGVHGDQQQIMEPAKPARAAQWPARCQRLCDREDYQQPEERAKA